MVLRVQRVPQQTLSGTTGSYTTGKIHGKLLSFKIVVNASTTFKIYTSGSPLTEYVFGTSGAAITVASSGVYYPLVVGNLASTAAALGAANQTNAYVEQVIDAALKIDVVGTDTKTWSVEIFYED